MDRVGVHALEGTGGTKDLDEAFRLFKLSAEGDLTAAQYHLGYCYENGFGCQLDIALATHWYEKAALGKKNTFIFVITLLLNFYFISSWLSSISCKTSRFNFNRVCCV